MSELNALIRTLTAGYTQLRVEFRGFRDSDDVEALIWAPEVECPRGIGKARLPSDALADAAVVGLRSIYNRVEYGFVSLEEIHPRDKDQACDVGEGCKRETRDG